ncbi:MAG: hypothetical protein K6L73_01510 [Cellvibrionaceae bacterium]
MHVSRALILLLALAFILSPTISAWVMSTSGSWYRPFVFWSGVIAITYIIYSGRDAPEP